MVEAEPVPGLVVDDQVAIVGQRVSFAVHVWQAEGLDRFSQQGVGRRDLRIADERDCQPGNTTGDDEQRFRHGLVSLGS